MSSEYQINGFIHIICENCRKGDWIEAKQYNNKKTEYNMIFCEKICEVSYRFRNGCSKIKKIKSDSEVITPNIKEIKLIGTMSMVSSA